MSNYIFTITICLVIGFILGISFSIFYVGIKDKRIEDFEAKKLQKINTKDNHSTPKIDNFLNDKCEGK